AEQRDGCVNDLRSPVVVVLSASGGGYRAPAANVAAESGAGGEFLGVLRHTCEDMSDVITTLNAVVNDTLTARRGAPRRGHAFNTMDAPLAPSPSTAVCPTHASGTCRPSA